MPPRSKKVFDYHEDYDGDDMLETGNYTESPQNLSSDTTENAAATEKEQQNIKYEIAGKADLKVKLESAWEKVQMVFMGTKWGLGNSDKTESPEIDDESSQELDIKELVAKLDDLRSLTDSISFVGKGKPGRKGKPKEFKSYLDQQIHREVRYRQNKKTDIRGEVLVNVATKNLDVINEAEWKKRVNKQVTIMGINYPSYEKGKENKNTIKTAERRVAREIIQGLSAEDQKYAEGRVKTQTEALYTAWEVGREEELSNKGNPKQGKATKRKRQGTEESGS